MVYLVNGPSDLPDLLSPETSIMAAYRRIDPRIVWATVSVD